MVAATAYSVGFVVINLVDAALWGLTGATSMMVMQCLGNEDKERTKEVAYKSTLFVFIPMLLSSIIIYPIREDIASIFVSDQMMIKEVGDSLSLMMPSLPFFSIFMSAMSLGWGSGYNTVPTAIGWLRGFFPS